MENNKIGDFEKEGCEKIKTCKDCRYIKKNTGKFNINKKEYNKPKNKYSCGVWGKDLPNYKKCNWFTQSYKTDFTKYKRNTKFGLLVGTISGVIIGGALGLIFGIIGGTLYGLIWGLIIGLVLVGVMGILGYQDKTYQEIEMKVEE